MAIARSGSPARCLPFELPEKLPAHCWLKGTTVPEVLLDPADRERLPLASHGAGAARRVALELADGRIASLQPEPPPEAFAPGHAVFDLDDSLVWSAFVEPHAHLDKGDLLSMGLPVERRLFDAISTCHSDYFMWTPDEVAARADFALRTAWAHGVRAMNTYADWPVPRPTGAPVASGAGRALDASAHGPLATWSVFSNLREQWQGRIDLVLSSLLTIDAFADAAAADAIARRIAADGGVLGVFVYPGAHVPALIPKVFEHAARHDLSVDFHVDEHLEPAVANLPHVLQAARRSGLGRRTTCGHVCVLQRLPVDERDRLLDAVAESGVTLVSLPATNLHLQDSRQEPPWATPRERGILPVHEARRRGIPLAFGADNHRDPFHPAGDLDPLHTLSLATAVAQLDDPATRWADTITSQPARALRLEWDGVLRPGAPADLVLHAGRRSTEWAARPTSGRRVLRNGQPLPAKVAKPPDLRELDPWRERRLRRVKGVADSS